MIKTFRPQRYVKFTRKTFAELIKQLRTLDEPEAESVEGGTKPSKTDIAAPISGSDIELSCGNQIYRHNMKRLYNIYTLKITDYVSTNDKFPCTYNYINISRSEYR